MSVLCTISSPFSLSEPYLLLPNPLHFRDRNVTHRRKFLLLFFLLKKLSTLASVVCTSHETQFPFRLLNLSDVPPGSNLGGFSGRRNWNVKLMMVMLSPMKDKIAGSFRSDLKDINSLIYTKYTDPRHWLKAGRRRTVLPVVRCDCPGKTVQVRSSVVTPLHAGFSTPHTFNFTWTDTSNCR